MRVFECIECGNVAYSKDWAYCVNPCNDRPMVEVLNWGSYEIPGNLTELIMAHKNKGQKQATIPL